VLAALGGAVWRPLVDLPDADMENLRQKAQNNLGKSIADFRVWFHVSLPDSVDAADAIDALNAHDCDELAEPVQDATTPTPPPYGAMERHHNAGPVGLGALATWEHHGVKGGGASIVDIEFGYDFHQDLPGATQIGPPGDPATQSDRDHGTATLGVIAALHNGWGTSGIAPNVSLGFAAVKSGGVVNIPQTIINAVTWSGTAIGTIILIELQIAGPAACGADPCTPLGLPPCSCSSGSWVPVEWDLSTYNAIQTAVGVGKIVIEPAGNGAQNLDASIYSTGNNGHWPFLAQNDSGAIMVGAGRGFDFIDAIGARICCSNYGSRLDVSGYGTAVRTTGYGDLYNAEGQSLHYTNAFAGTSSASATIAGTAALVQSAYHVAFSGPNGPVWMGPAQMRSVLIQSGSPQPSSLNYPFPSTQNIGPMPDASIAVLLAAGGCIPLYDTSIGNPGMNALVSDMLSFDDGHGAQLYAAGSFTDRVAAWDGSNWTTLPGLATSQVDDLEVFDDGNGAALYAATTFTNISGGVSRWNGNSWTALGTGFDGPVISLGEFNGSLYAGGFFSNAGGTAASNIARWNGSSWSAVGSGTNNAVYTLQVYNDGSGVDLYAGGDFQTAGGNAATYIARWDGSSWSAVGAGFSAGVRSLAVYYDGTSLDLYAGGSFQPAQSPQNHIARWNGQQWSQLGDPVYNGANSLVDTMIVYDDGTGPALFIGGYFEQVADTWSPKVSKWDGTRFWSLGDGVSSTVHALAVHDDGSGPSLYIGGNFTAAYDLPVSNVIEWSGCPFSPCPGDVDGDGTVGINDFLALLAAWGPNPGHPADTDGDGVVGIADFLALLGGWGNCPP
ncbi:MAG: S8 family serine peptidase, partial [Phycisphaerales bacterium]